MDRANFIKNVLGAAVAPALIKDFLIDDEKGIAFSNGTTKKLAIDINALKGIGPKGGKMMSPSEVLRLFRETGVLIYRNPYPLNPDYNPITILE